MQFKFNHYERVSCGVGSRIFRTRPPRYIKLKFSKQSQQITMLRPTPKPVLRFKFFILKACFHSTASQ
jgi:hypothetical protein